MTESMYWNQTVRPKLSPYGVLDRVENRIGTGMPDVNYCLLKVEGWFELKYIDHWPTLASSRVKLPHFSLDQLTWHQQRYKAGGRTCVLAKIGSDHLIIPPQHLEKVFGGATRSEYLAMAVVHGDKSFPTIGILKFLIGKKP